MNTTSQVEANKASIPAESGENIAASSENVCNDREDSYNNYNESLPSRSRYGRMIKPKSSMNNDTNSLQVCAVYFMLLKNLRYLYKCFYLFP